METATRFVTLNSKYQTPPINGSNCILNNFDKSSCDKTLTNLNLA